MHELPVTENILEISLRHARQAGAARITNIYLVIGSLASIIDDSVQFYWDILSKGTLAEGAKLHFRRIPAELLCLQCGQRFQPSEDDFSCPNCRSVQVKIAAGEEFYLEAIDIDTNGSEDAIKPT